jgi:tRNA G18 (ribose-2'-O)-methylase SpoU
LATELIDDPRDPRLDGYRALRDPAARRRIDRDHEVFVVEGVLVLRALLASPYRLRSVLVSTARVGVVEPMLKDVGAPLYVVPPEVLAGVAGFDLHRGVVALGERHPLPDPADLVERAHLLVVVEGVNDHENLGALFRNAAAFRADAVLLDPTTADPLYRRCLRVSMGHALAVPTGRMHPWPAFLYRLSEDGWTVVALTPTPEAEAIDAVVAELRESSGGAEGLRVALVVGAEGRGLSPGALAAAGWRARIPMAAGVDSLNVATAAAVALHVLAPSVGRPSPGSVSGGAGGGGWGGGGWGGGGWGGGGWGGGGWGGGDSAPR